MVISEVFPPDLSPEHPPSATVSDAITAAKIPFRIFFCMSHSSLPAFTGKTILSYLFNNVLPCYSMRIYPRNQVYCANTWNRSEQSSQK